MIERITFIDDSDYLPSCVSDVAAGRMDIRLRSNTICTSIPPSFTALMGGRPGRETREEHGERLRRAARDAARFIEGEIIAELKSMGHLV